MKMILSTCAAALVLIAASVETADAQRRGGPGFSRGGISGPAFRGAGSFRGGPAFRGPRVAGTRFVGRPFVGRHVVGPRRAYWGRPAIVGRRFVGPHRAYWGRRVVRRHIIGPRRFIHRGFVGAPYYYGAAYGCYRYRLVGTVYGLQWRWVNVCRLPYRFAYPYGYPYATSYLYY
jgi:hypothetical protein